MTDIMNHAAAARAAGTSKATLFRWRTSKPWLYAAVAEKMARQNISDRFDRDALVAQARLFSRCAHQAAGQVRKYTNEPYYLHPAAVADMVAAQVPDASPETIAAALLHDVVEDTPITHAEIAELFGDTVAGMVYDLTDQYTDPAEGNRAERKAKERDRLSNISPEAQTIKYADLIDNTVSIAKHDPDFARVYLKEKRALLDVMKGGDPGLWEQAMKLAKKLARKHGA